MSPPPSDLRAGTLSLPFDKPAFKASYHVEVVEGEGVFLLTEHDGLVLDQAVYERLAPWLDGQHTVDEMLFGMQTDAGFLPQADLAEVYLAVRQLAAAGFLADHDETPPRAEAAFWHHAGLDTRQVAGRLAETGVAVTAFGDVPRAAFEALLETVYLRLDADGGAGVVLADDYLHPGLDAYNREALRRGQPYLLVKPVGTTLWIGPLIRPGKTGCWACLAQRLRGNRPVQTYLRQRNGSTARRHAARAGLATTVQTALNMAATEVARWVAAGTHPHLEGTLLSFDTTTLTTRKHVLTRRPQCPQCGDPAHQQGRDAVPVILKSQKTIFIGGGGYRAVPPEATLARYQHHISPITGIVHALRRAPGSLDGQAYCYLARYALPSPCNDAETLREHLRPQSAGKGMTDREARTSGLCEAIERYSGTFQGDEVRRTARYTALGEAAIHPNACLLFSEDQYRNRATWNATCANAFQRVPPPFDETAEVEWTPVWSLTQQAFKYVPTAYCYYNYPTASNPFCRADSNGNAAGNTLEEAILQGFLELVERDGVALWWYNRARRPGVDLASFADPYFQRVEAFYHAIHRDVWVLDLTTDLGIPTFVAVSRRTDGPAEDILFGFGAHFDPRIGITRALTELNQLLPAVGQTDEQGQTRYLFTDPFALGWLKQATIAEHPYLTPDARAPLRQAEAYPPHQRADLRDDARACITLAENHGLETLVLDQTRPDVGLNVVKVIVPGLRHFWKRWAPGRLYEVPAALGWLPQPCPEEALNPIPMFL